MHFEVKIINPQIYPQAMLHVHTLTYTTVDNKKPAMPVNMRGLSIVVYGCILVVGGEGGIRTHVPGNPGHLISSQRRYGHFGTSPETCIF